MTITAKIIKDSVSEANVRLTTVQLRYPRFIHAELMTHRVFSRNASSSRAIPVDRLIQDIINDTAMPIHWGKNQKGMQADTECDEAVILDPEDEDGGWQREHAWEGARDAAIQYAKAYSEAGYHKQIVNRLLEPFAHINVLVTATDWSNFFALRDHEAAQPEFRLLAQRIKEAMTLSIPTLLKKDDWHLPYADRQSDIHDMMINNDDIRDAELERRGWSHIDGLIALSAARCASVSYMTVEGQPMTWDRAFVIYDKLLADAPIHASPAEHQARPDTLIDTNIYDNEGEYIGPDREWEQPELHGNFYGWVQYRKTLPNECAPREYYFGEVA